jgi:hypothetical protein
VDDGAAMRFFIDETSFELPVMLTADVLGACLDDFVRLVQEHHARGESVYIWSRLLEIAVLPDIPLCDLVFRPLDQFPIDRDTRLGLMEVLNRCLHWDDHITPSPDSRVEIDGVSSEALTVAVVHGQLSVKRGAACFALAVRPERAGVHAVRAGDVVHDVHFVTGEPGVPMFYRTLFEIEDLNSHEYMKNASRAFPDLEFAPGLASQFQAFKTAYREIRPQVTKHLGVLNDHFQRVHKERKDKTSEALGAYGINASGERGTTHKNKAAMKQRTITIDDVSVVCEWHTKIRPKFDRIYFHPGNSKVAGGRLIVGIFHEHLEL